MLYLSDNDIVSMLDGKISDVVDIMQEMFTIIDNGDYKMGGTNGASHGMRLQVDKYNELFIAMPGYLGGNFNIAGIKWHGPNKILERNDADSYYSIIINDLSNGKPIAVMRGDTITRYRTAAVAGLAARVLSYDDPKTLAVIGPGRINYLTVMYLLDIMSSIQFVKVKGRGEISRNAFIEKLKQKHSNTTILPAVDYKEVLEGADIVLINPGLYFDNYSDMPAIKSSWIRDGCVYICSSYANFPDRDIINRTINVCDLYGSYESYEEELGYPAYRSYGSIGNRFADLVKEEKLEKSSVLEFASIITGRKKINPLKRHPIIFSSGGMSLEDIAIGKILYQRAFDENIGMEVE